MGEALVAGLVASEWAPAGQISVVEIDPMRREALADALPGVLVADEVCSAVGGLVAVKPHHAIEAVSALAEAGVDRVLSIAAGVTTAELESAGRGDLSVIRAMPNTPALVRRGASAVAGGSHATDADLEWAREVLEAVGRVEVVSEDLMDAVTGLSGSGPAYVFLVAEALVEAGVLEGLSRPVAEALAHQTILGAGTLLVDDPAGAAELRQRVTSPGGTTAAGLRELERGGVRSAILDAVSAAAARSRSLGA